MASKVMRLNSYRTATMV